MLDGVIVIQPLSAKLIYALECPENETARVRRTPALRTEAYRALAFLSGGFNIHAWEFSNNWVAALAFATGTPDVGSVVTLMERATRRRQTLGLAFNRGTLVTAMRNCSVLPSVDELIDLYILREELRLHELRRRLFEALGFGDYKRMEQVSKWADKARVGEMNNLAGI